MEWSGLDPALVWGLMPRFVGVLYIFAFGALSLQLVSILGSDGAIPIAPRLARARHDFPGWSRFFEFPTVFWLNASDAMVRAVPLIGLAAGVLALYGGELGWVGLLVGWILWISVEPAGLIFPWDTMLQEVGFFALFLPLANELPDLHASALPLPTVAFMFRWLVLRLMLGFAKVKFIGTGKGDAMYLRGFLIWAPMPTPLAWWGHHAPRWLLQASLYFMFVGEAIAPVLGFFTGPLRLLSFAIMTALMLGIQVTGNWGYFNIGYVLVSVCLLDAQGSVFDVLDAPWAARALSLPDVLIHGAMVLLFLNSIVYFVFMNSWVTRTWVHWSWVPLTWNRPWVRALLRYFRALAPFHMVNGYGVFPPVAGPPLRCAPVFEGSDDGKTWKAFGFKYLPSTPSSKLPLVAPYHPRFDQALHYACIGIHDGSFFSSVIGDGSPYLAFLRSSWLDRVAQQILRDGPQRAQLGSDPFPGAPPRWVRVSTYLIAPTTPRLLAETGERWRVKRVGTLIPARTKEAWVEALAIPEPELFHYDFIEYKLRAAPLRAMVAAFEGGMPADRAVLIESDLTAEEVATFWSDFVPVVREARGDFARVHERAHAVLERFPPPVLYRLERILQRFAWLLRLRTHAHFERMRVPRSSIGSNFRHEMLLHVMVTDGPEAFAAALEDPGRIEAVKRESSDEAQLWTLTMVRYDMMMFHVRTFRWHEIGIQGARAKAPGIFEYFDLLCSVTPPGEEFRPIITKHDDGEFTIEGLYEHPRGILPAVSHGE